MSTCVLNLREKKPFKAPEGHMWETEFSSPVPQSSSEFVAAGEQRLSVESERTDVKSTCWRAREPFMFSLVGLNQDQVDLQGGLKRFQVYSRPVFLFSLTFITHLDSQLKGHCC